MFRERLKNARIRAGYKFAKDFAKEIGIPNNTYCGYERGDREPDIAMIQTIAKRCSVTSDYLLGLADDPQGYAPFAERQLSEEEKGLVRGYRGLSAVNREKVDSFVLGMVSRE